MTLTVQKPYFIQQSQKTDQIVKKSIFSQILAKKYLNILTIIFVYISRRPILAKKKDKNRKKWKMEKKENRTK